MSGLFGASLFGTSVFGLGQTLLRKLDPEMAHDLAIKSLQLGLYPRAGEADDPRLFQTLWGLPFPNPLGMAAGFDKNADVAQELLAMGFGFAEIGTLTPEPQSGNHKPRLFRSETDLAVINRLGFNNDGHLAALERLKARCSGIIGINIGANKESADRVADYVLGIRRLTEVAGYFTVNISSPNTPGLRDLQAPETLAALLAAVNEARLPTPHSGATPPLLVKLAPDIAPEDLPKIVAVALDAGIDGMVVSNTTLARNGLKQQRFAKQGGGLSGRPLFEPSTRMLAEIYLLTEGKLPLIGVGGVESGDTALAKLEAGASLVQLYTGLIFQGPALLSAIKRAITARLESEGTTLQALIGSSASEWAEFPPL